jgi:predicted nucleotidyltransferase component of viral defense system
MKSYDQARIRQAEIAQLIVLQCLFARKESRELIFQGGTAIRWFLGGVRFSEDLDFVAPFSPQEAALMVSAAAEPIRRHLVANFGMGAFSVRPKRSRATSYRAFVDFIPAAARLKVSVKVEFEQLARSMKPEATPVIMQTSPSVAYFLREAGFRTAGAAVIVNVETAEEILTDKLRALMERPYTKGRDFFDIWFLTRTVGVQSNPEGLRRKIAMYKAAFRENTPAAFYAGMDGLSTKDRNTLVQQLHQDLSRFLDADTLDVLKRDGYGDLLAAVQDSFRNTAATALGHRPGEDAEKAR